MNVRVEPDKNAPGVAASDYVRVSTSCDPLDDTVTLATIERVVARKRRKASTPPVHIKTLVLNKPMSPDAAVGFATCYAERKNIPVIFMNRPLSAREA
jgi:hypothetical protein